MGEWVDDREREQMNEKQGLEQLSGFHISGRIRLLFTANLISLRTPS